MHKNRITVSVADELYKWCSEQSEAYGMSIPSLFVIAMAQYKMNMENKKDKDDE